MKFSIEQDQKNYFLENGKIEFEDVVDCSFFQSLKEEKRDLWRSNPQFKKIISTRQIPEMVSQLTDTKPLRIGFDHFYPEGVDKNFKEISSYQGVVAVICITEEGNAHFFRPESEIVMNVPCYLIAYTGMKAHYVKNRDDSYTSQIAKLGYSSGDRLKDALNPIVYR